jgi:hypothetical protein
VSGGIAGTCFDINGDTWHSSGDLCSACGYGMPDATHSPAGSDRLDQSARILELESALGALIEEAGPAADSESPLAKAVTEAERVLRGEEPADA